MPKKEEKKKEERKKEKLESSSIDLNKILSGEGGNDTSSEIHNDILANIEKINEATNINTVDSVTALIKWIVADNTTLDDNGRPIFMDRIMSDGDARIKDVSMITVIQSLAQVPKITAMKQFCLDNIAKRLQNSPFMTLSEQMSMAKDLNDMENDTQNRAMKYIQMSRDFNSMPTIYRQLVDRLMTVPDDRAYRLKAIPRFMELPDEIWNKIIEIVDLWDKQ